MTEVTTLNLAGGGKVILSTVGPDSAGRVDLQAQLLDSQGAVVSTVVIASTIYDPQFRNGPTSGELREISGVALADGGFAVAYSTISANTSGHVKGSSYVVTFDAAAAELGRFLPTDWFSPVSKIVPTGDPHLVALSGGGVAVEAYGDVTILNAQGAQLGHLELGVTFAMSAMPDGTVRVVGRQPSSLIDPDGFDEPKTLRVVLDQQGNVLETVELGVVNGSFASETLTGSEAQELLNGGAGDDVLRAAGGPDALFGGAGRDRFAFTLDGLVDEALDFSRTEDQLMLLGAGGAPVAGANALLILDIRTGLLSWDPDSDAGAAAPVAFASAPELRGLSESNLAPGFQPSAVRVVNADGSRSDMVFGYGAQPFTSTSADYNAAGELLTYGVNWADGTSSMKWFDTRDAQDWDSLVADFDAAGRVEIYATYWDDGAHVLWLFDPDDSEPWSRIVDHYDAQGRLLTHEVVLDSGAQWAATYDVADVHPWAYMVEDFGLGYQLVGRSYHNADGSLFS